MKKGHFLIIAGCILIIGTTFLYFGTKGKETSKIEG